MEPKEKKGIFQKIKEFFKRNKLRFAALGAAALVAGGASGCDSKDNKQSTSDKSPTTIVETTTKDPHKEFSEKYGVEISDVREEVENINSIEAVKSDFKKRFINAWNEKNPDNEINSYINVQLINVGWLYKATKENGDVIYFTHGDYPELTAQKLKEQSVNGVEKVYCGNILQFYDDQAIATYRMDGTGVESGNDKNLNIEECSPYNLSDIGISDEVLKAAADCMEAKESQGEQSRKYRIKYYKNTIIEEVTRSGKNEPTTKKEGEEPSI